MPDHYVERRILQAGGTSLTVDLAHHLQRRSVIGVVVIVHDRPEVFLSVFMKAWIKSIQPLRTEAARTFREKRELYQREYERSQDLSIKQAGKSEGADVVMIAPTNLDALPPMYATIYLVTPVAEEERQALVGRLKENGSVIEYATAGW